MGPREVSGSIRFKYPYSMGSLINGKSNNEEYSRFEDFFDQWTF